MLAQRRARRRGPRRRHPPRVPVRARHRPGVDHIPLTRSGPSAPLSSLPPFHALPPTSPPFPLPLPPPTGRASQRARMGSSPPFLPPPLSPRGSAMHHCLHRSDRAGDHQPRSRHSARCGRSAPRRGVAAVAGVEPGLVGEPVEDLGLDLVDQLREGVRVAERVADAAGEERVAGEEVRGGRRGRRTAARSSRACGRRAAITSRCRSPTATVSPCSTASVDGDAGLLGDGVGVGRTGDDRRRRWRRPRRRARGGGPSAGGW